MKLTEHTLSCLQPMDYSAVLPHNEGKLVLIKVLIGNESRQGCRNLFLVDTADEIIWIAELPKSVPHYGSYQLIKIVDDKLMALCGSFYCEIDMQTGKVVSEQFTW